MRLWLLRRGGTSCDRTYGFVVRASNEEKARLWAFKDDADKEWLNPAKSTCEPLTAKGDDGVIIQDHIGS
jgi:hypothetical protein